MTSGTNLTSDNQSIIDSVSKAIDSFFILPLAKSINTALMSDLGPSAPNAHEVCRNLLADSSENAARRKMLAEKLSRLQRAMETIERFGVADVVAGAVSRSARDSKRPLALPALAPLSSPAGSSKEDDHADLEAKFRRISGGIKPGAFSNPSSPPPPLAGLSKKMGAKIRLPTGTAGTEPTSSFGSVNQNVRIFGLCPCLRPMLFLVFAGRSLRHTSSS